MLRPRPAGRTAPQSLPRPAHLIRRRVSWRSLEYREGFPGGWVTLTRTPVSVLHEPRGKKAGAVIVTNVPRIGQPADAALTAPLNTARKTSAPV
jgi:hypothetical protein